MDKRKAKKIAGAAAAVTLAGVNAYRAKKYVPSNPKWEPLPADDIDVEKFARDLSDAIRIKTISNIDESLVDWNEFDRFHALLEERFPLTHKALSKEVIGRASLMYLWKGKNPELDPIALLSHQDVVPINAGTENDWVHPAFDGFNDGEFIWGRGALDMKNHLIGVMEAVESLVADGFEPERDVYLLFGHNEEVMMDGDKAGAKLMCKTLADRGIHLDCIIDEGGAILPVNVKGILNKEIAGIGIAEKGHADFRISFPAKGGHSSAPPRTFRSRRYGKRHKGP